MVADSILQKKIDSARNSCATIAWFKEHEVDVMLSHILGWTSNRTEFRKGMLLESPAGSYYEVIQAKKIKVSVVMNPDDYGFEIDSCMWNKL